VLYFIQNEHGSDFFQFSLDGLKVPVNGLLQHTIQRETAWAMVPANGPVHAIAEDRWGTGDPGYKIKAEFNSCKHVRGVLSMARSAHPDSAGSQFFICVTPQPQLDGQFSAFGFVAEGIEVVDRLSETPVDAAGVPIQPPMIKKVTLRPVQPVNDRVILQSR
jgi:cyclophilin family peptidyl-prolyl cis-trans isomerase